LDNILLFSGIGLLGFSLSLVCVPFSRRVSALLKAVDEPVAHKVHSSPMPRLGGLAIYGGFWLSVLVLRLVYPEVVAAFAHRLSGLLLGSSLILSIGVLDDIFGLGAVVKLVVEVAAAVVVVAFGFRVMPHGSLNFLGGFGETLVLVGSVVWVIWVTNVFNLADGLDGLAAGIGGIVSLSTFVIGMSLGMVWVGIISIVLFGVCSGFLVHNFPPARIFMGDSGSLFLGFMFASVIMGFSGVEGRHGGLSLIGVLLLGVPMIDGVSAVLRRLKNGTSVLKGDRDHLHYKLLLRNGSRRKVALTIYLMTVGFSALALLIYFKLNGQGPLLALGGTCVAAVLCVKRFRLLELYISKYHLLPGRSVSGFLLDDAEVVRPSDSHKDTKQELTPVS
jgi:UDP-GlcNAc:undecaprenyl-phosphate/decaprenyl-phosphate GlcNAc-1-phosphate transferase